MAKKIEDLEILTAESGKKYYLDDKGIKRYLYSITCPTCGDVRLVKGMYGEGKMVNCKSCSAKEKWRQGKLTPKPEERKLRYWYFCPTCPSIRKFKTKRQSPYCRECNTYLARQKEKSIKRIEELKAKAERRQAISEKMKNKVTKVYLFCPTCTDVKIAHASKNRKQPHCQECYRKLKHVPHKDRSIATLEKIEKGLYVFQKEAKKIEKAKTKPKKPKKVPKPKKPKKAKSNIVGGVDGRSKVRLSEPKKKKTVSQKTEEQMIAEYLSKNKVKVFD